MKTLHSEIVEKLSEPWVDKVSTGAPLLNALCTKLTQDLTVALLTKSSWTIIDKELSELIGPNLAFCDYVCAYAFESNGALLELAVFLEADILAEYMSVWDLKNSSEWAISYMVFDHSTKEKLVTGKIAKKGSWDVKSLAEELIPCIDRHLTR